MSGIAVVTISIWTIIWKHQYVSLLTTSTYIIGTYALFVAGVLAIFGGFIGCCGIWREQRAMILSVSIYAAIYFYIYLLIFSIYIGT